MMGEHIVQSQTTIFLLEGMRWDEIRRDERGLQHVDIAHIQP
jgi:hypothetical protein